jgi:hypothetical protein
MILKPNDIFGQNGRFCLLLLLLLLMLLPTKTLVNMTRQNVIRSVIADNRRIIQCVKEQFTINVPGGRRPQSLGK